MKNVKQKPKLHRNWIDRDALDIVSRLKKKKYTTYLVGGCVRDLLVGLPPKDFDIVTDATPQEVKRCIPRAYIIGKRFRLVLARRGPLQFEIATFRRNYSAEELAEQEAELEQETDENDKFQTKKPSVDNVFGSPEQDATRRDFTINSLFYDPVSDEIIDYNNGLDDIEARMVKMIGDPVERLEEDSIRILRALRHAHKLGFSIESELKQGIAQTSNSLAASVLPRRREEILKFLRLKNIELLFLELFDLEVLEFLSPSLNKIYQDDCKRQVFSAYLERLPHCIYNEDSPIELFALLVMAYVSTSLPSIPEQEQVKEFMKSENFTNFLRNELGMFKYEQSIVLRAITQSYQLLDHQSFKRKGLRRQSSFLNSSSFSLSLMLAEYDYLLSPEQIDFWHCALKKNRSGRS